MKTPVEIEEILNSKRVSWKNLLTNNVIPSDILVKFFDKIFPRESGTIHTRVDWIADQYRKNGSLVGLEVYKKLKSERENFYVAEHLHDIIDGFADYFESEDRDFSNKMTATRLVGNWGNGALQVLTKIITDDAGLQNQITNGSALVQLAKNFISGKVTLTSDDLGKIRELVEKTETTFDSNDMVVIYMLYGMDEIFDCLSLEEILSACHSCNHASPEIIPGFSDHLVGAMVASGYKFTLNGPYDHHFFAYFKDEVVPKITDELMRERIVGIVQPPSVKLLDKDIDWNDIHDKMDTLTQEELTTLFSRTDVPVEFLNNNVGFITTLFVNKHDSFQYQH